jgi:hypothetical protein
MRVIFHPAFPKNVRKFQNDYALVSPGLAARFHAELDDALAAIKSSPRGAGHLLNVETPPPMEVRRKNLHVFPFFVLYGIVEDRLIIASLIPCRSDPLTWLTRL